MRLFRHVFPWLGLAAMLVLGVADAAARPVVTAARVGVHPDKTRFVLEMSEEVEFRVFTLDDPYRVVIDFPEVAWTIDADDLRGTGLVQGYRYGLFRLGTMRLVLDLRGPARVRDAFFVPPRDGYTSQRFVLDLEPVAADAFGAEEGRAFGSKAAVVAPASVTVPLPPTPPALRADEKPLVVIDAGHGGVDPGAIGVGDVYEKHVTLTVARRLKDALEAEGRYRVMLTRDHDVFLPLRERTAVARQAGAKLFISLHADSSENHELRGASIYTLSDKASDREAEMLAAKENRSDALAGIDLAVENAEVASILIDLAQRDTRNQSVRVANLVVDEMKGRKVRLLGRPLRSAGFAVLTAPDVPSILVEMGYLSNPKDAALLTDAAFQRRLADTLAEAVDGYFRALATAPRT